MGKSEASSTPQAGLGVYPSAIEAIPPVAASSERPFFKKVLSGLRIFAINFVIFAVLAELASLIYINVTKWPGSKPSYQVGYNDFSADINPAFGAWHRPNGHFIHKSGCYSVEYDTNSYGARDVERSVHSSAPRVIALGDSMIEGMGQPADKRLTNILEKETGREYLNFGRLKLWAFAIRRSCTRRWRRNSITIWFSLAWCRTMISTTWISHTEKSMGGAASTGRFTRMIFLFSIPAISIRMRGKVFGIVWRRFSGLSGFVSRWPVYRFEAVLVEAQPLFGVPRLQQRGYRAAGKVS